MKTKKKLKKNENLGYWNHSGGSSVHMTHSHHITLQKPGK